MLKAAAAAFVALAVAVVWTRTAKAAHSVAWVTAPNRLAARAIADRLVAEKLAACVNIIPGVQSVYTWEGKVEVDEEVMLMIKTRTELVDAVSARVNELHEYDVPEVIAAPIVGGSRAYLEWVTATTT